jgi:hypothetical protein
VARSLLELDLGGALDDGARVVLAQPRDVQDGERLADRGLDGGRGVRRRGRCLGRGSLGGRRGLGDLDRGEVGPLLLDLLGEPVLGPRGQQIGDVQLVDDEEQRDQPDGDQGLADGADGGPDGVAGGPASRRRLVAGAGRRGVQVQRAAHGGQPLRVVALARG